MIAPKNVCEHWFEQLQRFYRGQLHVVSHLGCAKELFERLEEIFEEDISYTMVTSFKTALRDLFTQCRIDIVQGFNSPVWGFFKGEIEFLVVYEAHRLKSYNARINVDIWNYRNTCRWLLLTGTPLLNNLRDLMSLTNILNHKISSSKENFESWYSALFEKH